MMHLTSLLALLLPASGDHAALHPAAANLLVEAPDIPAVIAAYEQAPMALLITDPEVHALVRGVARLDEDFDPMDLIRGQLAGELGPQALLALDEICSLAGDLRSVSFSAAGLEGDPASLAASEAWREDPALLLHHLGGQLVLEFNGAGAAGRLIGLISAGMPPLEALEEHGPATIAMLDAERSVHRFALPGREGLPPIWMVTADRLLVIGMGAARPEALQARLGGEESFLSRRPVPRASEAFTSPAGATILETSWQLPTSPFYASLVEAEPSGVQQGVAESFFGSWIPFEPRVSRQRLQLRDGRFVSETFEQRTADETRLGMAIFGQAPLERELLARIHPEAAVVWASSLSKARLVEVVAGLMEGVPQLDAESLLEDLDGLDLEGLLESVGDDFAAYMLPISGLKLPPAFAMLELRDAQAFEEGITELAHRIEEASDGAVKLETRPYRKLPVLTFRLQSEALGLPPLISLDPTIGIVGDRAVIGHSSMDVKREMRRLQTEEEGAHPAAEKGVYPAEVHSLSFVDWAALVAGPYDAVRAMASLAGDMDLPVDIHGLPESRMFTRFFQPTRTWSRPVEGGVYTYSESSFGPELSPLTLGAVGGVAFLLVMPDSFAARGAPESTGPIGLDGQEGGDDVTPP